jgi:hypothetical protein
MAIHPYGCGAAGSAIRGRSGASKRENEVAFPRHFSSNCARLTYEPSTGSETPDIERLLSD